MILQATQCGPKEKGGKKIQQNIDYCCNVTKEPLDEVKEESEKADLKFNAQKTKIIAPSPITSWQIDGEKVEIVQTLFAWASKIIMDSDCSHEIKRSLLFGRKI